jgi:hypothetical protein
MGAIHQALLMCGVVAGGGGGCSLLSTAPTTNLEFALVGECLVGGDGDDVTLWTDIAPAANDLTEINRSGGPYQKHTNEINGLSVIRAVGAARWDLDVSLAVGNFTYVAVLKPSTTASFLTLFSGLIGALQLRIDNAGRLNVVKTATVDMGSSSTTLSTSTFSTVAVTYDGSTLRFYLNGATDGTVSVSQSFTANMSTAFINRQSGDQNWGGDIAEQLFWSTVITAGTHLLTGGGGVTDELRTKYAHY